MQFAIREIQRDGKDWAPCEKLGLRVCEMFEKNLPRIYSIHIDIFHPNYIASDLSPICIPYSLFIVLRSFCIDVFYFIPSLSRYLLFPLGRYGDTGEHLSPPICLTLAVLPAQLDNNEHIPIIPVRTLERRMLRRKAKNKQGSPI